jgi:hypothetical protein
MVATITFNPVLTSTAAGSFNVESAGFIQGCALDDPAIRNRLSGGILASTETLPMSGTLGPVIARATNVTANAAGTLNGFTVFDQNWSAINSPQSPVPLCGTGMTVNFYRLGSGIRIPVATDPALVSLIGGTETQQVSWDFNLQRLVKGVAAYPANVITALTRALVAGVYQATATTTTAHGVQVGDSFTVSGETPAAYNGDWIAVAGTTGSTLVWNMTAVDPGPSTVQGTLVAGGGFLPCSVLEFQIGNSMTVVLDPVTNFATWNRSGSVAIILI